jgi:7-keto-8-aminopelargonate synthetase-like enzyme
MKSIIFVLSLFTIQLINAQTSVKPATPKITVMIGGKATAVQVKKTLTKQGDYWIESVQPKTIEELTKNMSKDGKFKFESKDYDVFVTNKGLKYIFIVTDKGLVKHKIG